MKHRISIFVLALLLIAPLVSAGTSAGWLLEKAQGENPPGAEFAVSDDVFTLRQSDFGATSAGGGGVDMGGLLPVVLSAAMPGVGEIYIGVRERRLYPAVIGSALMAMDIYGWNRVSHFHDKGERIENEYFAYADEHWSLDRLDGAFDTAYWDEDVAGIGIPYYRYVYEHEDLSLWVSMEDDRREYYENLGKWNQFVFGWDDFYDSTEGDLDLSDPAVSPHREVYRGMRIESNDAYQMEDRWMYVNIMMRLVSVAHVAWLQGWFGGDGLQVAGHAVAVEAVPRGIYGGRLGLNVSW